MYKTQRRIALIVINLVAVAAFIFVAINLAPQTKLTDYRTYSNIFPIAVTAVLFVVMLFTSITIFENARVRIERRSSVILSKIFILRLLTFLKSKLTVRFSTSTEMQIIFYIIARIKLQMIRIFLQNLSRTIA